MSQASNHGGFVICDQLMAPAPKGKIYSYDVLCIGACGGEIDNLCRIKPETFSALLNHCEILPVNSFYEAEVASSFDIRVKLNIIKQVIADSYNNCV